MLFWSFAIVGSVVEWLECCDCNQNGLEFKTYQCHSVVFLGKHFMALSLLGGLGK